MASRLLFPAILGGALALAMALAPRLGPAAALAVSEVLAVIAIVVGEQRWPYRATWARSHGDVLTDVAHAVVSGIATTQLLRILVQVGGVAIAGMLARRLGVGLWPVSWPLLAQLALALVIAELPQYWLHRWQHERDLLWRFHAVHHSAPRLYWLNAARFHPVDLGLLYLVGYLPLIAMGCPEVVIMLFALFDAVFGMLQHSNMAMQLGPLNYLFSAAEAHRWHHSRTLAEANTNYGSNLIVWDIVFGSFFLPAEREPPEAIGINDMPDFPQRYAAQLAAPFRWRRLTRTAPALAAPRAM